MNSDLTALLTVIGVIAAALLASLPGVISLVRVSRKEKADSSDVLTATAMSLVMPLKERIGVLEITEKLHAKEIEILTVRVRVLENENSILRIGILRLSHQVISLGGEPVFEIPESPPGLPLVLAENGEQVKLRRARQCSIAPDREDAHGKGDLSLGDQAGPPSAPKHIGKTRQDAE